MSRIFLAMNGKRIDTLDDLRNNFNPDQMLSFYRSGRLQKWLEAIEATNELKSINEIEDGYGESVLLELLMAIFELSEDQIKNVQEKLQQQKLEEEARKEVETRDSVSPAILASDTIESSEENGPIIRWKVCTLPEKLEGTFQAIVFESDSMLAQKTASFKKNKCDFTLKHVVFEHGFFFAMFEADWNVSYLKRPIPANCIVCPEIKKDSKANVVYSEKKCELILKSQDGITWDALYEVGIIPEYDSHLRRLSALTTFFTGIDTSRVNNKVLFQNSDMFFLKGYDLLIDEGSLRKYAYRYKNENWHEFSRAQLETAFMIDEKLFSRTEKGFAFMQSDGSQMECQKLPKETELIAKTGKWYIAFSGSSKPVLYYSEDAIKWSKYVDLTFGAIRGKIFASDETHFFLMAGERIMIFTVGSSTYIIGEFQ